MDIRFFNSRNAEMQQTTGMIQFFQIVSQTKCLCNRTIEPSPGGGCHADLGGAAGDWNLTQRTIPNHDFLHVFRSLRYVGDENILFLSPYKKMGGVDPPHPDRFSKVQAKKGGSKTLKGNFPYQDF